METLKDGCVTHRSFLCARISAISICLYSIITNQFQGSIGKKKEVDRMVGEGKLSQSEATEIGNRTDVLSYGLLAEINTFHTGRNHDLKEAHKHFLREQISHYQKVWVLFYF